jgi:transmembrane sensor
MFDKMMIDSDDRSAERDAIKRQAIEWLVRLSSGEVTRAQAATFTQWCGISSAHAKAFAEVNLLWGALKPAARNVAAGNGVQDYTPAPWQLPLGRRAFLGGAAASAAATAAVYLTARPPLDLWPSFSELIAQYRTATGEQRQLATGGGTAVEMNTRTSVNIQTATDDVDRIELIAGEAIISAEGDKSRPVLVIAAGGRSSAATARFDVRIEDSSIVCVTCLAGSVDVEHRTAVTTVRERQQVTYSDNGLGDVVSVDPSIITSWRAGVLIFRGELLSRAIDEINRYRPGRIVLVDSSLGRRRIDASFRLDRIGDIVPQIGRVFGARVRTFPGGLVLLG